MLALFRFFFFEVVFHEVAQLMGSRNPALASSIAGTTSMNHHTWLQPGILSGAGIEDNDSL